MATRADLEAKLAAIDQKKAEALKALQAKRSKLKAKLAALDRPTRSQRRLDARRKILLGAFVLEQLEHTGASPQGSASRGSASSIGSCAPTIALHLRARAPPSPPPRRRGSPPARRP